MTWLVTPWPLRIVVTRPGAWSMRRVGFVSVVARAEAELLARLVVFPDGAAGGARELIGAGDDGLQHRLEIERRADGAADITERGQLVHRASQVVRPSLQFREQPYVLDGDHGLIGERLEQIDLRVGERGGLGPNDVDSADRRAASQHRNGHEAAVADRSARWAMCGYSVLVWESAIAMTRRSWIARAATLLSARRRGIDAPYRRQLLGRSTVVTRPA